MATASELMQSQLIANACRLFLFILHRELRLVWPYVAAVRQVFLYPEGDSICRLCWKMPNWVISVGCQSAEDCETKLLSLVYCGGRRGVMGQRVQCLVVEET